MATFATMVLNKIAFFRELDLRFRQMCMEENWLRAMLGCCEQFDWLMDRCMNGKGMGTECHIEWLAKGFV